MLYLSDDYVLIIAFKLNSTDTKLTQHAPFLHASLVPLRCNYVWSRDGHYTETSLYTKSYNVVFPFKISEFQVVWSFNG